ncbi:MAG: spermidine/putrescine ABC transporter substrate-binding protein [Paracoccaceae bacterium]|nr:MAG: spermidine/putrescine ABC transporter substrate-binding protein [Paracoccaceae bacterium]
MTRTAAIAFAGAIALAAGAQAAEIRVLNWKGYGTDEPWAVAAFEKATGHTVVHDYFNSEQEMLTRLRTNPGAYDVVLINSAFTRQAAAEGLIQPIDTAGMKNVADLAPNLAGNPELAFDGKVWGVAWVWGVTGIAYNTAAMDRPDSLEVFWDPAMKGRVGWRDDALESVQFAALVTGQSINDIRDLDAVRDRLARLMPQIRVFWSSENDWNQFLAAGEFDVATYWSGSAARSKTHFGLPVEFVIPREGAIGWLDGLSIPAGSANVEAAKAFIDWMIDPEFYVKWDTEVGAPASANLKAAAALPEDAFNRRVLGDPANIARVEIMKPVSDADRERFLALWQELKAAAQ